MFNWFKDLFFKSVVVPLASEDIVYQETDHIYPQYSFKVVRIKPYIGQLTVMHNGDVFCTQTVEISYDAKYGIDLENLELWARTAVTASDDHMAYYEP